MNAKHATLTTDLGRALNDDASGALRDAAQARLTEATQATRAALEGGVRPQERPLLEARAQALERASALLGAAWRAAHG